MYVCHGSSFPFSTHIEKKWPESNGDPFANVVVECNFLRAPNSPNWSQNTALRMLKQRKNFRNFTKCGSWMAMNGHERSWWLVLWDMNVLVLNAAALRNVLQHTCAAGSWALAKQWCHVALGMSCPMIFCFCLMLPLFHINYICVFLCFRFNIVFVSLVGYI